MDRASIFVACHGALHCNDISQPSGGVLADGAEAAVPMGRYTVPEAQEMVKGVSVRRKGLKPHPASLAFLDEPPASPTGVLWHCASATQSMACLGWYPVCCSHIAICHHWQR